jgi:hypothetical protein
MKTVALRTALIWHDEVMDDVVSEKPIAITIGSTGKPTFVVPDLGLPKLFAIVRPGNRGYLLTLADTMGGTICIDGEEKDVADFVKRGGGGGEGPGGFHATPISGRDWGVIDLDPSGVYKLFFQFVPIDDAQPFFTKPVLTAGIAGYAISIAVLAGIFYFRGIPECNAHGRPFGCYDFTLAGSDMLAQLAEAAFRAWGIATAALGVSAIVWWITKKDGEQQASLMFSIMMHAALLLMTYQLYDGTDPFVWPGSRAQTGNYIATRIEKEPEPKPVPTVGDKNTGMSAMKSPEPPKKTATKNNEGKAGGQGEHERARDPNAKDEPPSWKDTPLDSKSRQYIPQSDMNLKVGLTQFNKMFGEARPGDAGYGKGTGTGVGAFANGTGTTRGSKGTGTGGGGNAEGDFVSDKGKIDTGTNRPGGGTCAKPPCGTAPKEVKVTMAGAEGDLGGLTADEIDKVVRARAGVFRACYQKELNRSPGIGGKLVIHFVIGGDGNVQSAKTGGGSSLRNEGVESCVTSNVMRLRFPAKGGLATVNYPFLFQPGG